MPKGVDLLTLVRKVPSGRWPETRRPMCCS
jgi:hypothetical protein